MKHTNSALNFQMAQYRAIFSDPLVVKGLASALVITAGAAYNYAYAANGDSNLDLDELKDAFKDGKGTVTITGQSSDTGAGGKYSNITISADPGKKTQVTLPSSYKFVIEDSTHPYNNNYFKADGAGSKLNIYYGSIEVGPKSSGSGTASNPGLEVSATKGGYITLMQQNLDVKSELHISTSGRDSYLIATAKNITIGSGSADKSTTPTAKVVVGDISNGNDGAGSTTFGWSDAKITVNNNGELDVVDNAQSNVQANMMFVNGGALHFKKGTNNGQSSVNSNLTDINDGYVKVASGSNATLRQGVFNVNGRSNVEIGSGFTLNNNQTVNISDTATFAASEGAKGSKAQVNLYNGSELKLSKAKLKEFLTGLKEDGSHVQYVDIAESDPSKQIKTAGQGNINLNAKLVFTGDFNVDLADKEEIQFASNTSEGGKITAGFDSSIQANNVTVSKKVDNAEKLSVQASNLTLGSADFDSKSTALGVRRLFAQNVQFVPETDSNSYTLQDTLYLSTNGKGVIKGNVNVSGGQLRLKGNSHYELEPGKDLVLEQNRQTPLDGNDKEDTTLAALYIKDASLKVSGKLHTSKEGTAQIENGSLDASHATSLKIGQQSINLGDNSAIVLDGSKVLDAKKDPSKVSFYADAFAPEALNNVGTSNLSTVTLTNLGSLTMEQYEDLQRQTKFDGFFNGFGISDAHSAPEMDFKDVAAHTPDAIYGNTQVTTAGAIDRPVSVGNVKLSTGGSLQVNENQGKQNLVKLTNASANGNASHSFVQTSDGKLGGVELASNKTALQLQGSGNIGDINGQGKLFIGSPDGTASANVSVKGNIGNTNPVEAVAVQSNSSIDVTGETVKVANLHIQPGSDLRATRGTVSITSNGSIDGDLIAKELVLDGAKVNASIAGGGSVSVENLRGTNKDSFIQVGLDDKDGRDGTLIAKNMALSGGTIFVDPSFDSEASYAVVQNLSGSTSVDDAGVLNGKAYVGQNAVLAVGFENKDDVVSIIKNKLNGHGAFVEGSNTQNALVLNKKITLTGTDKVVVDPQLRDPKSIKSESTIILGANSAIVVTDKVFESSPTAAAITLSNITNSAGKALPAKVESDQGGVIVLSGRFSEANKDLKIFSGTGLTVTNPIQVQSANGLLGGTIEKGSSGAVNNLALDRNRLRIMFKNTSKPVADMLEKALAGQDPKFYDDPTKAGAEFVAQVATDSQTAVELDRAVHAASYAGAQQAAIDTSNAMTNAMMDRGEALNANREGRKLKDIYTQAYYKAKAEQKGNKIEVTTPALAANTNTGVWATPTYVNTTADGYEAENASYGADIDIKGVTVGADTLVGNATIGVAASIGTGKADGNGQGKGLKDDFDYYGLGAYTAMSFGQFSLIGDTSVTAMKHDISGASGIQGFGNLSSSVDSLAISAGVTGKYKFETPYMDVTPHFGTRFLRLSTDSYDLYSDGKRSNLMNTDYDAQNIFSFPVGVSLSKQYHVGGWILNPDVDLTLTVNAGDTDAKSSSKIYGVKDPLDLTTQVMDDVTYRAKVGFGVTNGNFNTNINFHYTGSENTESYGINANVGYDF